MNKAVLLRMKSILALSAVLTLSLSSGALGQNPLVHQNESWKNTKVVYLLQGEKRKLAEDFVAQLDGDALHVSLQARGLVSSTPDDGLLVTLIQPSGERQDQRPDENGNILFEGVEEGLAALVVTADALADTSMSSLYAAIPFFAVPADNAGAAPDPIEIPMALVEPGELVARLSDTLEDTSDDADVMAKDEFDVVKYSRFRVQRLADGSVQGQVVVPQRGYLAMPGPTQVTFQKDGMPLASTVSDEAGNFLAQNVPVGVNSIVATGRSGHAAYSVEIVEFAGNDELLNPVTDAKTRSKVRFVAKADPVADTMIVCLIPPALMDEYYQVADERLPPRYFEAIEPIADMGAPVGPGSPAPAGFSSGFAPGAPSYGGFGGGGGGGFGGAGAAAGLVGLAGIAAIADDDDGFNANLASPLTSP